MSRVEERAKEYHVTRYGDQPWEKASERYKEFCRGVARRLLMQEFELRNPKALEAIIEDNAIIIDRILYERGGIINEVRE